MKKKIPEILTNDPTAEERKKDHIDLAFRSKTEKAQLDGRFFYEPMLAAHPKNGVSSQIKFLEKQFLAPIWVSSMTGGTQKAKKINTNLAKACAHFKMGMGLGSCRQLLYSDEFLHDFAVRDHISDQPLYANLGIAQVENLVAEQEYQVIEKLVKRLQADGLVIHVNPLQEWMQKEGDSFAASPIETIKKVQENLSIKLIVKEVGHGMGVESLRALMRLPLEAIEFAAFGGTNFSVLENMRDQHIDGFNPLSFVGHDAGEMVDFVNEILSDPTETVLCKQIIVSGGIRNFLDGYYLTKKLNCSAIYGQASVLLKYALEGYDALRKFLEKEIEGLEMAHKYLTIRK